MRSRSYVFWLLLGFYDLPIKYYYVRFPVMQNQNSPIGQTQHCAVGLSIPWTGQFQEEHYYARIDLVVAVSDAQFLCVLS